MRLSRGAAAGEILVASFEHGEDLLQGLREATAEAGLKSGLILSGSGTLERISLESATSAHWPPPPFAVEKNGPAQIISAQGMVLGGSPEATLGVARRSEVFAGKLQTGSLVLHTAEILLLRVSDESWSRRPHHATGIPVFHSASGPLPPLRLLGRPIDPEALRLVPRNLLRKYVCLPVACSQDTLIVAMADPSDAFALDDLRAATRMRLQTVAVPAQELLPLLHELMQRPIE